jgi:hypothetical protein
MRNILISGVIASAMLLVGCGTTDDMPTQPNYDGSAELAGLQNYAALGNSLTAGYQSGAWGNPEHVAFSFPNLLAGQLGIADFDQVSMDNGGISFFSDGTVAGNMTIDFDAEGNPIIGYSAAEEALAIAGALFTGASSYVATDLSAPRNFGIPGITLMHSAGAPLSAYAAANPNALFYMNAENGNKTQLQLVAESDADFVTCWLGNNDVLGFVSSGGGAPLTDAALFQASLDGTLATLAGVDYLILLNIPAITSIPYVTYFNPVFNAMMDEMGAPVHAVYGMDDETGMVMPYFTDEGTGNYLLLSAMSAMMADPTLGASMETPLPDSMILDAAELEAAEAAAEDFNTRIADGVAAMNGARDNDVLLADANSFFTDIVANGYDVYGSHFTTEFVSGGIFSLDGVHPTSLGYGMVTNFVIDEMNAGWGFNIESYDLGTILGVTPGLGNNTPVVLPDYSKVSQLFQ